MSASNFVTISRSAFNEFCRLLNTLNPAENRPTDAEFQAACALTLSDDGAVLAAVEELLASHAHQGDHALAMAYQDLCRTLPVGAPRQDPVDVDLVRYAPAGQGYSLAGYYAPSAKASGK